MLGLSTQTWLSKIALGIWRPFPAWNLALIHNGTALVKITTVTAKEILKKYSWLLGKRSWVSTMDRNALLLQSPERYRNIWPSTLSTGVAIIGNPIRDVIVEKPWLRQRGMFPISRRSKLKNHFYSWRLFSPDSSKLGTLECAILTP